MTPQIEAIPEVEIFEHLDFEPEIPCSYTDCDNKAVSLLQCGVCYIGQETMCAEHTMSARITQWMAPQTPVKFDQTCQHMPELGNCKILPMS